MSSCCSDGEWSTDAADDFEKLTHAAQWRPLLARIVSYKSKVQPDHDDVDPSGQLIPCLELIDTESSSEEDINIGDELVKRGHAVRTQKLDSD